MTLAETQVRVRSKTSPAELEELGEEIAALAAHLHAVTYLLLARLAEFDAREGWSGGFRSCAHWLSWRTGIDLGAAREKVRVARALRELPGISDALRRGALSYAKARALTRVATAENESALLEVARHGTASQVEQVVRAWRRVDRLEEAERDRRLHEARSVTLWIDDDGSYVLRGRLPPEAGTLLEKALEAADAGMWKATSSDDCDACISYSPAQRRADALAQVAADALRLAAEGSSASAADGEANAAEETAADAPAVRRKAGPAAARRRSGPAAVRCKAGPAAGDRYQVVVHVDAEALREGGGAGQSAIAGGPHVSAETSRRLACDGTRAVMMHARIGGGESTVHGQVVMSSGVRRTVPASLRRALEWRDRGTCRFPGCGALRCDAHHVRHWADGGATRLDNLLLLCRRHHRAVHEEGWTVALRADGEVAFRDPHRRVVPNAPSPLAGEGASGRKAASAAPEAVTMVSPEPREAPLCARMDVGYVLQVVRGR